MARAYDHGWPMRFAATLGLVASAACSLVTGLDSLQEVACLACGNDAGAHGGGREGASDSTADVRPEADSSFLDSVFLDRGTDAQDSSLDDSGNVSLDASFDASPDALTDSADGAMACDADAQNDPANCGQCGNACSSNQICAGGMCGYRVGGTITGLSPGDSIDLRANGGNATTVSANGTFTLSAGVPANTIYAVTAALSSGSPIPETCHVHNAAGIATMPVSNVNVVCIPSDLLYYFTFSGNTKDSSGNGNDGVVTGNAKPTSDRFGAANEAYNFDGTTGTISAPGGLVPLHGASRTLTFWVELLTPSDMDGIVSWGGGNCNAHVFGIGIKNGANPMVWEGCNDYETNQPTVPVNVWTFLAVVFSSAAPTSYTLYVNGQSSAFQLALPPDTQAGPLTMGFSSGNGRFLHGNLDSVHVYGRALSPSEINGIYTWP
jgi:hypothetical protein